MKNKYGFVPKNQFQPDTYEYICNVWNAVYKHNGVTYYIEPVVKVTRNPVDLWTGEIDADGFELLVQTEKNRLPVMETYKSCKQATDAMRTLLALNS